MKNPNAQPIRELRTEIQIAIRLADHLFALQDEELVITWTTGGQHRSGSLHYKRRAFDAYNPRHDHKEFLNHLSYVLGTDYDVIDEGEIFHVEYDPR